MKVGGTALVASGAFAGLAGGVLLTSESAGDRITTAFSGNYGWQGLLVALLAAGPPAGRHPDGARLRRAPHG